MMAASVFMVLGPLFLLMGVGRCIRSGISHPQGIAWLIVGAIFSAVAFWLGRSH